MTPIVLSLFNSIAYMSDAIKEITSIYDRSIRMYKKNKVSLRNIKKIMTGKVNQRKQDRLFTQESMLDMTLEKLKKGQKEIDKRNKTKKKLWREKQKKVFY